MEWSEVGLSECGRDEHDCIGVFASWQSGEPPLPRIGQKEKDGTKKKERGRKASVAEVVTTYDGERVNCRVGACLYSLYVDTDCTPRQNVDITGHACRIVNFISSCNYTLSSVNFTN